MSILDALILACVYLGVLFVASCMTWFGFYEAFKGNQKRITATIGVIGAIAVYASASKIWSIIGGAL